MENIYLLCSRIDISYFMRTKEIFENEILPVEIVLSPEWWHKNEGICFDNDFFFHPAKRVESEQLMEKTLYEKWGNFGMGKDKDILKPELGAVHLAAGFVVSEMLGCEVRYSENHPPQVIAANSDNLQIDSKEVFNSAAFKKVLKLAEELKKKHGYVSGDINWGGVLNLALDLRGESIFTDMMLDPDQTKLYFDSLAGVIDKFTTFLNAETGTTSISVNRTVAHFKKPIFLHSECSHTMISAEDYETYLLNYDDRWSMNRPFGIHYCGADPHRMAESFAKIKNLDFLDLGWGGDVALLRSHLPNTFFNIRLSPVEIARQSNTEIAQTIRTLVKQSGDPKLTGICCINMDDSVSDDRITTIFETVEELKKELN